MQRQGEGTRLLEGMAELGIVQHQVRGRTDVLTLTRSVLRVSIQFPNPTGNSPSRDYILA